MEEISFDKRLIQCRVDGEGNGNSTTFMRIHGTEESVAGYSPWGSEELIHFLATKERER